MASKLNNLEAQAQACCACELCKERTNPVFGEGSPSARVMIIGEAPGKNEDLSGRPFVGAAGKNLDRYLSFAGLSRDDVYIANVLKCRPPGNRNPRQGEIEACKPLLIEQVTLIEPEYIVTLGNFATQTLLETKKSVSSLRGKVWHPGFAPLNRELWVFPIFHPAAAIYDRDKIEIIESDFKFLGKLLEK